MPAKQNEGLPSAARFIPPVVLAVATLATRLIPFNTTLIGWDEWILSGISVRLARVYLPAHEWYDILVPTVYSYPPVFFWLNGGLVYALGPEPLVLRLVTIASEVACVVAVTVLAQMLAGRFAAWTSGLLAFATLYLSFHETVTIDFLLSFWIALSAIFLLKAIQLSGATGSKAARAEAATKAARNLVFAVFFSSLAAFTKYHGVVYHAILCVLIVIVPETRRLLKGRTLLGVVVAALALPCALLGFEALTWHFYGFSKTHIAEVLRVMGWTSYVQDPYTGAIVQPHWYYYFVYVWNVLGPLVCGLGVVAIPVTLVRRNRTAIVLVAIIVLWFLWASTASLKNARYILPGVLLVYPLIGVMMHDLARLGRWGKPLVVIAIAATAGLGLWQTRDRITAYQYEAAVHQAVYNYIRDHVPRDAVILAESAPFQWGMSLRSGTVRPMRDPESPSAFADANYFIAHEWARQLVAAGAIPSAKGYLNHRAEAVSTWKPVLDLGEGRYHMQLFKRPG